MLVCDSDPHVRAASSSSSEVLRMAPRRGGRKYRPVRRHGLAGGASLPTIYPGGNQPTTHDGCSSCTGAPHKYVQMDTGPQQDSYSAMTASRHRRLSRPMRTRHFNGSLRLTPQVPKVATLPISTRESHTADGVTSRSTQPVHTYRFPDEQPSLKRQTQSLCSRQTDQLEVAVTGTGRIEWETHEFNSTTGSKTEKTRGNGLSWCERPQRVVLGEI